MGRSLCFVRIDNQTAVLILVGCSPRAIQVPQSYHTIAKRKCLFGIALGVLPVRYTAGVITRRLR